MYTSTHFNSTVHIRHRICMKFPPLAVKNQTATQAAWKCRSLPGPLAPPDISRPKRNITARSYSCTTCNKYDTRQPSSTVPRHFITKREIHIKCVIQNVQRKRPSDTQELHSAFSTQRIRTGITICVLQHGSPHCVRPISIPQQPKRVILSVASQHVCILILVQFF